MGKLRDQKATYRFNVMEDWKSFRTLCSWEIHWRRQICSLLSFLFRFSKGSLLMKADTYEYYEIRTFTLMLASFNKGNVACCASARHSLAARLHSGVLTSHTLFQTTCVSAYSNSDQVLLVTLIARGFNSSSWTCRFVLPFSVSWLIPRGRHVTWPDYKHTFQSHTWD